MNLLLAIYLRLSLIFSSVSPKDVQADEHNNEPVHSQPTNFTIKVMNSVNQGPASLYSTHTVFRGILLGGMRRLQNTNSNFTFTYSEHQDYGPFLESVNGLAGNFSERTYWKLEVKKTNGTVITPNVGIGCYIPSKNEEIIFSFTKY